jgi:hypothetical protein
VKRVAEVFGDTAKKAEQALAKDAAEAYHGILKDTEHKTVQVVEHAVENEGNTVTDLTKAAKKDAHPPEVLDPGHGAGPGASKGGAPKATRKAKYSLPRGADRSPAQTARQVDPKTHDLAKRVNDRRLELEDDSGNNYAAIEYEDEHGDRHVVVDHSDGPHSERVAGVPILDRQKRIEEERAAAQTQGLPEPTRSIKVTRIYSERNYCNQRSPNCNAWTRHYFPDAERTYAFPYDHYSPGSKAQGNRDHEDHIRWLFGLPPIKRRS